MTSPADQHSAYPSLLLNFNPFARLSRLHHGIDDLRRGKAIFNPHAWNAIRHNGIDEVINALNYEAGGTTVCCEQPQDILKT